LLARLVYLLVSVVVLIIVAGILLALLKANPGNTVVSEVHGWGRWLVGPFNGMFSFHHARLALAVNWGIAAIVYLFAGGLISRVIGRSHNRSFGLAAGVIGWLPRPATASTLSRGRKPRTMPDKEHVWALQ
jgi:hypothetical protein